MSYADLSLTSASLKSERKHLYTDLFLKNCPEMFFIRLRAVPDHLQRVLPLRKELTAAKADEVWPEGKDQSLSGTTKGVSPVKAS